jgi:phage tail sheath gpL-like
MTAPFQPLKLPAGLEEPGIYVGFVLDSDPGLSAPNKRELIFGYMTAGYPGVPDAPVSGLNITDVENTFGPKSMLAHRYAAAKAEVPIGFEAVLVPLLEPSAGTASAITFEITGEPTAGVLSSATAAAAADTMIVSLRGRGVQVGIRKDDTGRNRHGCKSVVG